MISDERLEEIKHYKILIGESLNPLSPTKELFVNSNFKNGLNRFVVNFKYGLIDVDGKQYGKKHNWVGVFKDGFSATQDRIGKKFVFGHINRLGIEFVADIQLAKQYEKTLLKNFSTPLKMFILEEIL